MGDDIQQNVAAEQSREYRLKRLLDETLVRRVRGEAVSDESIIVAHPDLMPELADELRTLGLINAAEIQATSRSELEQRGLHIRCPHCNYPVEFVEETYLSDVACPSCGSHFGLVEDDSAEGEVAAHKFVGRFELLERLGTGAFGSVWSGHDTELDRRVSVKIPRKGQLSPAEAEQFVREARAAARLTHPNIVRVYEVGRHEDQFYIVSDLVEGMDLARWLTQQSATPREAAALCATVAEALYDAHEHGVIHRDLKPSNIILDAKGQPHLTDFGLAKRDVGEITVTLEGKLLGTPAYMSPEQARGSAHDADRRSDIYSLGVILFELLTGERPFRGNTRMLLHQVLLDDAPSTRKLNNLIPKDLDSICLKCLEKDPSDRYQSSKELAADLRRFLTGQAVCARPITKTARIGRWCKRNPRVPAAATLLVAAILWSLWIQFKKNQQVEAEQRNTRIYYYQSLMRQARALRLARETGYRARVWSILRQALALKSPVMNLEDLRREAAACMGDYVGLDPITVDDFPHRIHSLSIDQRDQRFAAGMRDSSISIRDLESGMEMARLYCPFDIASSETKPTAPDYLFPIVGFAGDNDQPTQETIIAAYRTGEVWRWRSEQYENWTAEKEFFIPNIAAAKITADGKCFVSGSLDGQVTIWSLTSRLPLKQYSCDGGVYDIAVTPVRKLLAASFVGDQGRRGVRLWNLETEKVIRTLELNIRPFACGLSFSSDGQYLACGLEGGFAVSESPDFSHVTITDGDIARDVAVNPDNAHLAIPSYQQSAIRIWNMAMNRQAAILEHPGQPRLAAFSNDGQTLVTGANREAERYQSVRIWRLSIPDERLDFFPHDGGTTGLSFRSSGDVIATTGKDRTVKIWNTKSLRLNATLRGLRGPGQTVHFSPSGRLLAAGELATRSSAILIWDVVSGKLLLEVQNECGPDIFSVAFSPDSQYFLAAGRSGVQVWQVSTISGEADHLQVACAPIARPTTSRVHHACFSPDSTLVGWVEQETRTAHIWNIRQAREMFAPPSVMHDGLLSLEFFPDSNRFVMINRERMAEIWPASAGKMLSSFPAVLPGPHQASSDTMPISLSPDGLSLATASVCAQRVNVWNTRRGELVLSLPNEESTIWYLAWGPDGNRLAVARSDGTVSIWNISEVQSRLADLGLEL